ncbi:MAG: 1-acyl-sn-glycerol-3-phosphate acyltransferase [Spirochaetes bacterium]|nr:MAG: 1-acyl-sn-glycerol-3-phosphate acyltransferase [Spirochaetota bacterium]
MRNIFFYTVFAVLLIPVFIVAVIPPGVFRLFGKRDLAERYLKKLSRAYFGFLIKVSGSTLQVEGAENLPEEGGSICLVSNHQSYFDILIIEAATPFLVGFVAKKELTRLPILSTWMKVLGCVPIDRKSPRSAVEAINKGVESIKNGNPLVLFPEGTRSRGQKMNRIKPGSLKLAIKSGAVIIPITINHSYRIYEENSRVCAADVLVIIHKAIDTKLEENSDSHKLAEKLQQVIESGLAAD